MSRKAPEPRRYSRLVVDGLRQTPARAMLRAVGFRDEDFGKPRSESHRPGPMSRRATCTSAISPARRSSARTPRAGRRALQHDHRLGCHLDGLARDAVFPGSREVIADSIETVVGAEGFDGFVAIGGCDKNMPGCAMAIARLNRPAVFVYGGTILSGRGAPSTSSRYSRR